MKCPVCDKVNTSMLCPKCGFDSSGNCERYPTFGPVGQGRSVSALRREWQEKQESEIPVEPEQPVRTVSKAEIAARLQEKRKISVEEEFPPRRTEPPAKKRKLLPLLIVAAFAVTLGLGIWIGSGLRGSTPAEPGESQQIQEPAESEQMLAPPEVSDAEYRIAMITDFGDITDQSVNQTTYEACKDFAEANGIDFIHYRPAEDTTAARVAMVDAAVVDGYNVIVMSGNKFGETLPEVIGIYPEVKFIALDAYDGEDGYQLAGNLYAPTYRSELAGYMAGYAAVKMGYRHFGFLGAMATFDIKHYGYGYLQGIDYAAKELGITSEIKVEYVYANQYYGDANISAIMDTWYRDMGVEVVFACGGGVWTSAAEAAGRNGGKVIGADTDQSYVIDSAYGAGITLTSAMKGLEPTLKDTLNDVILNGNWDAYSCEYVVLGVHSLDPEKNYVQLPINTTQWSDSFTQEDYRALVEDLLNARPTVPGDVSALPLLEVTVEMWADIYS